MIGIDIGRYRTLVELGTGGMGTVYLAHDSSLDREVALKVMRPDMVQDADLRRRFEREAKALARIAHPNVVSVFDHGYHQGAPYIVMERLHGKDLKDALKDVPVMTIDRRLEVVTAVLRGLAAVHAAGIVHRDIKPANVFLCGDASVKIVDFGVARLNTATISAEGSIVGSLDYMSPEQVQGKLATQRSDLFSVGSTLCELFGGAPPFRTATTVATLFKIVHDEPDLTRIPQDHRHAALFPILRRALAKAPEDRYSSAREFEKALEGLIQASPGDRPLAEDEPGDGEIPSPGRSSGAPAPHVRGTSTVAEIVHPALHPTKPLSEGGAGSETPLLRLAADYSAVPNPKALLHFTDEVVARMGPSDEAVFVLHLEPLEALRAELRSIEGEPRLTDRQKDRRLAIREAIRSTEVQGKPVDVRIAHRLSIVFRQFRRKTIPFQPTVKNLARLIGVCCKPLDDRGTKFDLFPDDRTWSTSIRLQGDELEELMRAEGVSDPQDLAGHRGLRVMHLPPPWIDALVIPAVVRKYVSLTEERPEFAAREDAFFNGLMNLRVGLG